MTADDDTPLASGGLIHGPSGDSDALPVWLDPYCSYRIPASVAEHYGHIHTFREALHTPPQPEKDTP